MSAGTGAFALRRAKREPRASSSAATSSKRCGCRGTITVSVSRRQRAARQRIEDQRLLAFARRRGDPHRPIGAEQRAHRAPERERGVGDAHVELEVARDGDVARAGVAQARAHPRRSARPRPRAPRTSAASAPANRAVAAQRALGQARVDEKQRDAARRARGDEVRPHLGFHQQPDARLECARNARTANGTS